MFDASEMVGSGGGSTVTIVQDLSDPQPNEVLSTEGINNLNHGGGSSILVGITTMSFNAETNKTINTSAWRAFEDFEIEVTAVEDNSLLEISVTMWLGEVDNSNKGGYYYVSNIDINGALVTGSGDYGVGMLQLVSAKTSDDASALINITIPHTHSAGDTLTIKPVLKRTDGSRSVRLNKSQSDSITIQGTSFITVREYKSS